MWVPTANAVPATVYMDFANGRYWYNGQSWVTQEDASGILAALGGTFTRASTAYYTNSAGLLASAASGVLRFDYNPVTLAARGILLEGARTNICLQSQTLGTTWSPTNLTVGDNTEVAPDGTTTAETLTATAGNGTLIQDLGVIASAAKVFSIWLKRKTGTGNIDMTLNGGTGWTTKTITSAWARYEITATLADPDVGIRIVTSGDEIYAWGGQCEAAAFASSYIPTTTGSVTRAADSLLIPVSPPLSVGTVLVVTRNIQPNPGFMVAQGEVSGSNAALYTQSDTVGRTFNVVRELSATAPSGTWLDRRKSASAGNTGGTSIVVNGGTVATDANRWASTDAPSVIQIGARNGAGHAFGNYEQLALWLGTKVSDAELQRLTT